MSQMTVSLVTPEREVVNQVVDKVLAPSVMGQIGVLPGHQLLLAALESGPIVLHKGRETDWFAVSEGFIEVEDNHVLILVSSAEHAVELDSERALGSLRDAEKRLKALKPGTEDYDFEQERMKRAQVRLQVASKTAH